MGNYIDIVGNRYGKLTVIKRVENSKHGDTRFLCCCDCGNKKVVSSKELRNGRVQSCGCLKKNKSVTWRTTHGLTDSRIHHIWSAMKQRCYNENNSAYNRYGGRGITVCDEWKNDFVAFYNWATSAGYNDNLTIDRVDPNGNYCPENCRWISQSAQCVNKANTLRLEYKGESHTINEWAKILGMSPVTIRSRYYVRHWPVEEILSRPVKEDYVIRNNAIKSGKRKLCLWIDKDILEKFSTSYSDNVFAMSEAVEAYIRNDIQVD